MHGPGSHWQPGPDGVLRRRAARVILVDAQDRVLLLRGHDVDQPERSWWFTVGGGLDPDESSRAAAVREVREETGLVVDDADLVGPVLTRSAVFDFAAAHLWQDEEFFLARVDEAAALSREGWTAMELDVIDEVRWWNLDDLARVEIEVFPADLVALVRPLLAGWDGVTRHLGLVEE
nr:NUDIX domain-containing protein [Cellulomonas marina]